MVEALHPGTVRAVNSLLEQASIDDATILEVGADWNSAAATKLLAHGATKVISTNFAPNWPTRTLLDGRLEQRTLDARRIAESLPADSVDIVFGVAVMEHFLDVPGFLAGARHVLRRGGILFVQGGPLWSSRFGHHVWVDTELGRYHFNDSTNPIEDWSHLFLSRGEMISALRRREIAAGDAEAIAAWVYDSDEVNRVGYATMCRHLRESGFVDPSTREECSNPPPPDIAARIAAGPHAGEERYDVTALTLVARK
jgi:SAM-dependent methyltransferase